MCNSSLSHCIAATMSDSCVACPFCCMSQLPVALQVSDSSCMWVVAAAEFEEDGTRRSGQGCPGTGAHTAEQAQVAAFRIIAIEHTLAHASFATCSIMFCKKLCIPLSFAFLFADKIRKMVACDPPLRQIPACCSRPNGRAAACPRLD